MKEKVVLSKSPSRSRFKFRIGDRVKCTTGERGQVLEGWMLKEYVCYSVEREDGRIIDCYENELSPARPPERR